jgi:hypothetical protein
MGKREDRGARAALGAQAAMNTKLDKLARARDLKKASGFASVCDDIERMLAEALEILDKVAVRRAATPEGDSPAVAFTKHLASLAPEQRSLELAKIAVALK